MYFLVHAKHKTSMTPEQIARIENNARLGEYDRRSRKKSQRSPQSRKKPQRSRKKTNFFIKQSAKNSAREVADRKLKIGEYEMKQVRLFMADDIEGGMAKK